MKEFRIIDNNTHCASCGEDFEQFKKYSMSTGYGSNRKGVKICYACCDNEARKELLEYDRIDQYISSDFKLLTTWSGGILGKVTWAGKTHVFSRHRRHIDVTDVHGQRWYGVGAEGEYTTLRKRKKQ